MNEDHSSVLEHLLQRKDPQVTDTVLASLQGFVAVSHTTAVLVVLMNLVNYNMVYSLEAYNRTAFAGLNVWALAGENAWAFPAIASSGRKTVETTVEDSLSVGHPSRMQGVGEHILGLLGEAYPVFAVENTLGIAVGADKGTR